MKSLLLIATLLLAIPATAKETTLIVSIQKSAVKKSQVRQAVNALNHKDLTTGTCYVDSAVIQYLDYSTPEYPKDIAYYGVALVDFKWECDNYAKDYLTALEATKKYFLWSDGEIGPWPVVSGSN